MQGKLKDVIEKIEEAQNREIQHDRRKGSSDMIDPHQHSYEQFDHRYQYQYTN